MAPSAVSATNGTASTFGVHAASSSAAIHAEHEHAAHNYHPLPVVFSKASGVSVWDPEGK